LLFEALKTGLTEERTLQLPSIAVGVFSIRMPSNLAESKFPYAVQHLASPQRLRLISGKGRSFTTRRANLIVENLEGSERRRRGGEVARRRISGNDSLIANQ
jgi:hypothetical protein